MPIGGGHWHRFRKMAFALTLGWAAGVGGAQVAMPEPPPPVTVLPPQGLEQRSQHGASSGLLPPGSEDLAVQARDEASDQLEKRRERIESDADAEAVQGQKDHFDLPPPPWEPGSSLAKALAELSFGPVDLKTFRDDPTVRQNDQEGDGT